MKTLLSILALNLCFSNAFGSAQPIISGWQPGEIYFVGVHSQFEGFAGLYFSSDNGENIALRDSVSTLDYFGGLLADTDSNAIHRLYNLPYGEHLLTRDGGYTWETINDALTDPACYATGVIPGEIYRQSSESILLMERSVNYGADYVLCSTLGFPDTVWIYSAALGVDSGEVYVWSQEGDLYYSEDHAEHFTFQGNLHQSASVDPQSELVNGAEPGEFYVFHQDTKKIWRVSNYGADVGLIEDFPRPFWWYSSIAVGGKPGELYFLTIETDPYLSGTMWIYYTCDYGESWIFFEHIVEWEGIEDTKHNLLPTTITFDIWPNPANPSFTMEYALPTIQTIELGISNLLG
jgi:hypothetical protein